MFEISGNDAACPGKNAAVMPLATGVTWWKIRYAVAMAAVTIMASSQPGFAAEVTELPEPLFTADAQISTEVEAEFGYDDLSTGTEFEVGFGGSRVFFDTLEIGVDVPFGVNDPDTGKTVGNLGDIELSAQYQFRRVATDGFNFSLAGSVAAPTGSRRKDIGGTGEWGVFALSGVAVPLPKGWPQLAVQTQFGYQEQIRLSNEQRESAEALGVGNIREKSLIWRLALSLPVLDGRVVPTFEVLGQTVLDAVAPADEGTTLELGGGVWWNHPFPGSEWEGLSIGLAARGPVTRRREADFSTLFVVKYEFD